MANAVYEQSAEKYSDSRHKMRQSITPNISANSSTYTDTWVKLAALFLLGLASLVSFTFVGTLNLQEIILLFAALFYLVNGSVMKSATLRNATILSVLWVLIQLATDFYRDIPLDDKLRGAAKIIFFMGAFIGLWQFLRTSVARCGAFMIGVAATAALSYWVSPTSSSETDPWKWHFGAAVTGLVVGGLCLFRIGRPSIWAISLLGLAAAHFLQNFRSIGGICALSAALILGNSGLLKLGAGTRRWVIVGASVGVIGLYSILAAGGFLGEEAMAKWSTQVRQDGAFFTVLFNGRGEIRPAYKAVSDSPLVGYGSWARRPEYIQYMALDGEGYSSESLNFYYELGTIPTHSHILGAWVDAGPIPGLIWLAIWVYIFNRIIEARVGKDAKPILALYTAITMIWIVLFSPLGAGQRASTALGLVVIFAFSEKSKSTLRRNPQ